jgi:hypothetical protein
MANQWSIIIDQLPHGALTFTPDLPGAKVGQPLGVNGNDNVTWNNRTNNDIKLSVEPPGPTPFPFDSIPAGAVSNPIFNVTETVGYSGSIVPAKPRASPKGSSPGPAPVHWIVVV